MKLGHVRGGWFGVRTVQPPGLGLYCTLMLHFVHDVQVPCTMINLLALLGILSSRYAVYK